MPTPRADASDGARPGGASGPSALDAAGHACPPSSVATLRAAAARLVARGLDHADATADHDHLAQQTERLVRLLAAEEPLAPHVAYTAAESALLRRLLELLRAELVFEWMQRSPPPAAEHMLALLARFEAVRASLEPRRDDRFAAQLASPLGLELVVEIAHDLRSPLTSILFLCETLRGGQSGALTDTQRRQLGIIYSAAFGLISVASDVVELARGGSRLAEQEPVVFALGETLASMCDVVQPMAEQKSLELLIRSSVEPDRRLGYPVALSRVLLNLTTNALKFTEAGAVEVAARALEPPHVEFSVSDTGHGLDPDVLRQLYEPFRLRPHQGSYDFSGSGLGLAICRKLVEAMGAELRVEPRAAGGTRFAFVLALPAA